MHAAPIFKTTGITHFFAHLPHKKDALDQEGQAAVPLGYDYS